MTRPPLATPATSETQTTALVVEDDASIADFVRVGLSYEGFEVQVVTDGLVALRTADRFRPQVVILDLMLPGMDGLEVCRRLRAFGDPAIIVLTARDGLADRLAGLQAGADDYVVKPFHFEELVARIRARWKTRHLDPRLRSRSGRGPAPDGSHAPGRGAHDPPSG